MTLVGLLILGLFVLSGCGSTTTGTASANGGTSATTGDKVLKVGSDITYPPFEFMNTQNQPVGFDIDLMNAIAKDMGYTVNFETSSFDGLIPSLQAGKYDAVISAMTITPARAKNVLFSDSYFKTVQYIAVKKGSPIKTLQDLKGKRIGVQNATTGQYAVEKLGFDPKKYDTTPDALTDLLNGGVDAVVADGPVVLYFAAQHPNADIVAIEGNIPAEDYGIAMKKDNTALSNKINASLKKLIADGQYNEIYKKWFKKDAPKF